MAMTGGGSDPSVQSTLSEINVTPLVDVMLVLLTIFMVASSVETIQVAAEREKLLKEREDEQQQALLLAKLQKLQQKEEEQEIDKRRENRRMQFMMTQDEKLKEIEEKLDDRSQNVPVDLPKANSEAVNLAEQKKIVVTLTRELEFYIGDTKVADCKDPAFLASPAGAGSPAVSPQAAAEVPDSAFRNCLAAIEKKLVANEKLKAEGECYLRADRKLDYGKVLALMAAIRKAGVTKFGLVSEQDLEEKK
jgi:biopolymer transport protein ExbD